MLVPEQNGMNSRTARVIDSKIAQLRIPSKEITFFLVDHQFLKLRKCTSLNYRNRSIDLTCISLGPFMTSKWSPFGGFPDLDKHLTHEHHLTYRRKRLPTRLEFQNLLQRQPHLWCSYSKLKKYKWANLTKRTPQLRNRFLSPRHYYWLRRILRENGVEETHVSQSIFFSIQFIQLFLMLIQNLW